MWKHSCFKARSFLKVLQLAIWLQRHNPGQEILTNGCYSYLLCVFFDDCINHLWILLHWNASHCYRNSKSDRNHYHLYSACQTHRCIKEVPCSGGCSGRNIQTGLREMRWSLCSDRPSLREKDAWCNRRKDKIPVWAHVGSWNLVHDRNRHFVPHTSLRLLQRM